MTRLYIKHPSNFEAERRYILDVTFGDWLGIDYAHEAEHRCDTEITIAGKADEQAVCLSDAFFRHADGAWLKPDSLPKVPLRRWRVANDLYELGRIVNDVPVIYGEPAQDGSWLRYEDQKMWLGIDI